MLVTKFDDLQSGPLVDTRHITQQRPGGGIQIHTDPVHTAFNHRFQRLMEMALVHVMLILADADRLRIELNKFRQGVLQTTGDGDGPSYRQVQIREFLPGDVGRRVDGCA